MMDDRDPVGRHPGGLPEIARELTAEVAALRTAVRRIPVLETRTAIIGVMAVVLILLVLGFGFLAVQNRSLVACQANVNQALVDVLEASRESGRVAREKDRASMDALLAVLLNPAAGATEKRDAIVQFRQRNAATEQTRNTTPYPQTRC
jgi:hypothetical protein